MLRRPKFSRRDNYWFWHSFVVCIFDNKFLRRPIVISDDMPTYWALIDAFYDFWWFWPTAVYTARELYELTIGRFRILFYIVCGQFLHILWLKKTHAICHNGLFWSNPFLSISQHRPEVPTRVVFGALRWDRFAPVCMHSKLAECGARFAPAGMARMPWLGIRARHMRKLLAGGMGTTFFGIFVNDSTQHLLSNMLQEILCGVGTQKTIPNMQKVLSILMRSMVASKNVYVLQLLGWGCKRQYKTLHKLGIQLVCSKVLAKWTRYERSEGVGLLLVVEVFVLVLEIFNNRVP